MSRPRWYYESDGGLGDWTGSSFTVGPTSHYLICEDTGERRDYPSKRVAMKTLAELLKEADDGDSSPASGCGMPG